MKGFRFQGPTISHIVMICLVTVSSVSNYKSIRVGTDDTSVALKCSNTSNHMNSPERRPKIADGCYHVLLDVGSNIGVHGRFLFEPEKYPDARNAEFIFTKQFGSAHNRDNRDLCVITFEPNPVHAKRQNDLKRVYQAMGWRFIPMNVGVADREGNLTFFHSNDENKEEWGFSTGKTFEGTKNETVKVIQLSAFLMEEVYNRKLPAQVHGNYSSSVGPRVVMKLDIEGSEYTVLPDLIASGALCTSVDYGFGEFHNQRCRMTKKGETCVPWLGQQFLRTLEAAGNCKTKYEQLDDETYLHDGQPFPVPPAASS